MSASIRIKKLRPGDDTDTYCGRCKVERAHQVVALNTDGTPASVICRTCRNQHRFHKTREPSNSTAAGGVVRKARATAEPPQNVPAAAARDYSPKAVYAVGEWIDHSKFGQGKVTQARAGKVEVRFESGSRVLVHAG